ncbi:MAG TPA: tail fiber domain-containing protein [Pyrinomonadaceae bacterium]
MTNAKRLVSILAVIIFALAVSARAQTNPVEVAVESERALFNAHGEVRLMQVEIYAPGGELLFAGGAAGGKAIEWGLRDQSGRPVADGTYLAAITVVDAAGKVTKRVEQVMVGNGVLATGYANAPNPTPDAPSALTGEGTAGRVAKFTAAYQLSNSVIAESAGKVGVGTTAAPTAALTVNGAQPAAQPGDGTEATPLLDTTGGKGGNTTTAGQIAGRGASIFLRGGNGGNAVSSSTNGSGGNITLQGGSPGTGGTGGATGKVLLAPTGGNVGVGTDSPTSKLTVRGTGAPTLVSVENTSSTMGTEAIFGKSSKGNGIHGVGGSGSFAGVYGEPGAIGYGVWGKATGVSIGVVGESTSGYGVYAKSELSSAVYGESTDMTGVEGRGINGTGVVGRGKLDGVWGYSSTGNGVHGKTTSGYAGFFEGSIKTTGTIEIGGTIYFGTDTRQMVHLYSTTYGIGVQNSTEYFRTNGGFAWYKGGSHNDTANNPGIGGTRLMKLDSAGNLQLLGTVSSTSDRNAKSNFSAVSPRAILDQLNSLPIETWSYKADGDSVRHIGPVAQDFKAAFDLGADDKTISTVDADGVTMAAVQGLYQMMLEKEKQNEEKDRKIDQLARKLEEMQTQLAEVRRDARRQRATRRRR